MSGCRECRTNTRPGETMGSMTADTRRMRGLRGWGATLLTLVLVLGAAAPSVLATEAPRGAEVTAAGDGTTAGAVPLQLTLDDAIEIALEHGHNLGIAEAGEDAARARVWQARSAFLPAVSASASYTRLDETPYMDASQFGDMFAPLMVPFEYLVDEGYL